MQLETRPSPKTSGSSGTPRPTEWVWRPQPGPQEALVDCSFSVVFFGGARGGGKTDGVLGKWALKERRYGSLFNAIMFRRTTVSAEDAEGHHAPGPQLNNSQVCGDPLAHQRQLDHARKGSGVHRSIAPRWLSAA